MTTSHSEHTKGSVLRDLVRQVHATTEPGNMARLLTEIASRSFYLAAEVAVLHREYLLAEQERKRHFAATKLARISMGSSAARAEVEAEAEIQALRAAEIDAQGEWMSLRLMHEGIRDVMTALQMRLAYERDEAKRTHTQP